MKNELEKKLLTMRQLAAKTGFPWSTLKWWVEQGVLPFRTRSPIGYLLFDEEQALKRLAKIKKLEGHLTKKEIRKIFNA